MFSITDNERLRDAYALLMFISFSLSISISFSVWTLSTLLSSLLSAHFGGSCLRRFSR